jgi:hypothetical protein
VGRLTVQSADEWTPFSDPSAIAVLDRTVEELAKAYGWSWDQVDEDGLGPMFYIALAWDGVSRYLLTARGFYPEDGVAVETSAAENPAAARADLLVALDLRSDALLAVSEGDIWFARWDPPHNAGDRPSTAAPRSAPS